MLGKRHPNLFVFLTALGKEEKYAASKRRAVALGEEPDRKRRKYVQNDRRIERIVSRYAEYQEEQGDALEGDWEAGTLKYLVSLGHSARSIYS